MFFLFTSLLIFFFFCFSSSLFILIPIISPREINYQYHVEKYCK
uniref:Uncharacterized protein n=1 Tax=Heterorhabditis bacteriophora TaxID=37862 RepID=A0A1I7W756_HETBA